MQDRPEGPSTECCSSPAAEARRQLRNGLQLMRSIIRRSAERARNVNDYSIRLVARMDAIAPAMARMIAAPEAGTGLSAIVYEALDAQDIGIWNGTCTVAGPDLQIAGRAGLTLALLFHELAMNAAEHGVLTGETGALAVTWRLDGDMLAIDWIESGAGFLPGLPGFGMLMMDEVLSYDLDAGVTRHAAAQTYRVTLVIPLDRLKFPED